jgi:Putative beta barrel porin-7 (BBP7)
MVGLWFVLAGHLAAQTPSTGGSADKSAADAKSSATDAKSTATESSDKSPSTDKGTAATTAETVTLCRSWARVDYLLWWVKDAPLPVPLVTTGNPSVGFDPKFVNTVNTAGAIGQPGTQVLYGDHNVHFRPFSGMQLTLGSWIDDDQYFGLEASGVFLERHTNMFAAASDSAGHPPLYFPIFSDIAGAERAVPIADPLRGFSGNVLVASNLRLWGTEANVMLNLIRYLGMEFSLIGGFRYVDLRENLQIYNATTDLIFGNMAVLNDSFGTTNQFYGGQFGGRFDFVLDHLCLEVTSAIALGPTNQVVAVNGEITQPAANALTPPGPGSFPGGLFAQTTNIGQRHADPFTTVLSLELRLAYEIAPRIRASVGYDILYWNSVVRPGNQINHSVNLSQNAILDPNGVGKLVGAPQPAPLFNRSDFWAQGLNIDLEFRF